MSLKFPDDLYLTTVSDIMGPSPYALFVCFVHAPARRRDVNAAEKKMVDLVNPSVQVQLTESGLEIAVSPVPGNYCT